MKVVIVGAGIGGLSTALYLSKKGEEVTVIEKLDQPGGRARSFSYEEFSFDMGPSWYLMPEVFEKFFHEVGEEPPQIMKLNPLFSLYTGKLNVLERKEEFYDDLSQFKDFESYLEDTQFMYNLAMEKFLFKEVKFSDFLDPTIIKNLKRFPIFTSLDSFNRKYFSDDFLLKALDFSSVFLGGSPFNIPAFYAMVNYAIYGKGVYYPKGGFAGYVKKLFEACKRSGVQFKFNREVNKIDVDNDKVISVRSGEYVERGDVFIFNMDYHYADTLLPIEYTMRGESYWERRKLSPSAILAYVGVEGEINATHHGIFINGDWKLHFDSISKGKELDPENMSYYVSYRKATDSSLKGKDLVFLIPTPAGLSLPNYQVYVRKVIDDFKAKTRSNFQIKYEKIYTAVNFEEDYNAYKGSAFGLAHTLDQTGPFRLPMKNRKLKNLFYVGQYTQPGIGVPMVTISAMIVGDKVLNWSKK